MSLSLQPHHFSFQTSYASFNHRLKVITLEKPALTQLRVQPGAPSIVLPRPELLLTTALITDADCSVSVTLTTYTPRTGTVYPALHLILSLWQLN